VGGWGGGDLIPDTREDLINAAYSNSAPEWKRRFGEEKENKKNIWEGIGLRKQCNEVGGVSKGRRKGVSKGGGGQPPVKKFWTRVPNGSFCEGRDFELRGV